MRWRLNEKSGSNSALFFVFVRRLVVREIVASQISHRGCTTNAFKGGFNDYDR